MGIKYNPFTGKLDFTGLKQDLTGLVKLDQTDPQTITGGDAIAYSAKTLTYTDGVLTRIDYPSGFYKTFSYTDGVLTGLSYSDGNAKSFTYTDGKLTAIGVT